ncbi:hypothetical protein JNK13_01585 [bacterium]|nr:hypothetical protein [bacterium]
MPDIYGLAIMWTALALLTLGLVARQNRKVHISSMVSGLTLVFALVLILQITKRVIGKVASGTVNEMPGWLMSIHVSLAVIFIALSVVMISTGIKKARGYPNGPDRRLPAIQRQRINRRHRVCGLIAYGAMWVVALTAPGSLIAQILPK